MRQLVDEIHRFVSDEGGVDSIEYGIIAALIFLAIVGAVALMAGNAVARWGEISTHVNTSTAPAP